MLTIMDCSLYHFNIEGSLVQNGMKIDMDVSFAWNTVYHWPNVMRYLKRPLYTDCIVVFIWPATKLLNN